MCVNRALIYKCAYYTDKLMLFYVTGNFDRIPCYI